MRSTLRDAARRAYVAISRATIRKANDKPLLQEVDVDLTHDEGKVSVERFQQYGFTAVPLPEDAKGGKAAEAIIAFINGNRAHGVVLAIDDRRYRIKGLKDGEVAIYDDQGQKVHITRDGIKVDGGDKKKPVTVVVGNATIKVEDGKITAKVAEMPIYIKPTRIDLAMEDAPFKIMTEGGPSPYVFAKV